MNFAYPLQPFIALVAIAIGLSASVTISAQQVEVRLRTPVVSCSHKTIRVQDVAVLSGGNSFIRQKLSGLDLDEFTADRPSIEIQSSVVRYRILMAGIDAREFVVAGHETMVRFEAPIDGDRLVEQLLTEQLIQTFHVPDESVELQLLTTVAETLQSTGFDLGTLQVTAQFPLELPLGTRNFEVSISDDTGHFQQINVSLKIAVYRDLVMAKQNISRGEILDREKIERVRRPIDNPQVAFASYEQTVGKQAQHDIQQFSLVKAQFVRESNPGVAAFDVTRNSVVNIVIQRGPLSITLKSARANENGRIGDYLNFTNPKSGETVRAKLVDRTTAMIEM
jgi:flagella basal body P-ring formation protein FlgA